MPYAITMNEWSFISLFEILYLRLLEYKISHIVEAKKIILENVKNKLPFARLCNIKAPKAIQVIPIEPDKSDAAQYRIAFSSG